MVTAHRISRYVNPGTYSLTSATTDTSCDWFNGRSDWLAPTQPTLPTLHVEMDIGGRRVRGTADSWVRHDNGGWTIRNVRCDHYQTPTWGIDEPTGGWWPATATSAGNSIILTGNTITATANTITFGANTDAWGTNVQLFDATGWKPNKRYRPPQRILNHRGEPVRAENKGSMWSNVPPEELVALQLLRKMVPHEDFKKYLKHGFVSVRGPSGLVYQIGRSELIKVWDDGELVATLCVHLKDWYGKPPTDEVVAKMIIAECDEPDLWKRSNKAFRTQNLDRPRLHVVGQGTPKPAAKPLPTIFGPEAARRSQEPIYRFGAA